MTVQRIMGLSSPVPRLYRSLLRKLKRRKLRKRRMSLTAEQYRLSPPLKFPWKGKESGMELVKLEGKCPKCSKPMADLRGQVYESFDCIELNYAGLCHECKVLGTVRGRIYPKDNRVLWDTDNGWSTSTLEKKMTRMDRAVCELKRTAFFSGLGMGGAIALSYVVMSPTITSWICWVSSYIVINVVCFGLFYFIKR